MAIDIDKRIVFVDTSIFEANNFLEGDRIKQLLSLAEDNRIKILMPIITYHEILSRASKNIEDAASKFKKLRNEARILRTIPSYKDYIATVDQDKANQEFKESFDKQIELSKIEVLDYPTVNLKEIFTSYFTNQFPFSNGSKKHEFPDAFAIVTIENWCVKNNQKCVLLSNDKDIINYSSALIHSTSNLEIYLDWLIQDVANEQEAMRKLLLAVTDFYWERKPELQRELNDWLYKQIKNEKLYYSYYELEVHRIDIDRYKSTIMNAYKFIAINNEFVFLDVKATIVYRVQVEIDDKNSFWYDSEDKIGSYRDTEYRIVHEEAIINLEIKVHVEEYEPVFVELWQINEGKDLIINHERND